MSDQFLLMLPALLALLLLALFSSPATFGNLPLVPNIAWVMTLIVGFVYPAAWPRWFAFTLGLLQDIQFGTPLGSQALLTLLLVQLVSSQARRQSYQRFRVRWLEASGALILWHLLLWGLCAGINESAPPLRMIVGAGIVSAAWHPLFYLPLTRLLILLPPTK